MYTSVSPQHLYSLDVLRSEVKELVTVGKVSRQQPIRKLGEYIPEREWQRFVVALRRNDFLKRDPIGELLSHESWRSD